MREVAISANRKGVDVGDAAPELSLSLIGGGEWRQDDHRGKVIVLSYFATF